MPETRTPYTVARDFLATFSLYSRTHRNEYTRLRDLRLLEFTVQRMRATIVLELRRQGATWREVAEALDTTESAARHAYGVLDTERRTQHH